MTFPTTSVLDSFSRANENPLSDAGKWSGPIFNGDNELQVVSDQAATPSGGGDSYWSHASFSGAVEVFCTVTDYSNEPGVMACLSGENLVDGPSGYFLGTNGASTTSLNVLRFDGGTQTLLLELDGLGRRSGRAATG